MAVPTTLIEKTSGERLVGPLNFNTASGESVFNSIHDLMEQTPVENIVATLHALCEFKPRKMRAAAIALSPATLESARDLCYIFQGAGKIFPAQTARKSPRCAVFLRSLDA